MNFKRMVVGTFLLACAPALAPVRAGGVVLLDDKSDFVGSFTVIDFESRGDGSPLSLSNGSVLHIASDEYGLQGITISASVGPSIGHDSSPVVQEALELGGSTPNSLLDGLPSGFLRFDFNVQINAFGLFAGQRNDGAATILRAYDALDVELATVPLSSALDGTVLGQPFGASFNIEHGFFGVHTPDGFIDHVIITEDLAVFDDVHFGIIPLPSTALLLLAGGGSRLFAGATTALPRQSRPASGLHGGREHRHC